MNSSKKIYAVNGSPRRCGNTAELLNSALAGAADGGADKKRSRAEEFPVYRQQAYQIGRDFAGM